MAPDQKDSSSDSIISSSSSSSASSCLSDDGQDGGVVSSWSSKRTYGLMAQSIRNMVRKRRKRMLDENLSVLRSITHSNATRKSCIISDAFKYIEELKQRVHELNRDLVVEVDARQRELLGSQPHGIGRASSVAILPTVTVVEKECGLEIHVSCKKMPGLLIAILEAVEALGLNVLQARVSCKDYFLFEALSGKISYLLSNNAPVSFAKAFTLLVSCNTRFYVWQDKQGKIADPNTVKGALLQVLDKINPGKASTGGSEVMD